MSDLYTFQDPTTQYAQPKFEHQPQPVPGREGEMTPRPDQAEKYAIVASSMARPATAAVAASATARRS